MSKNKSKSSTPKPYIKPSFKLDLHTSDNSDKLDVLDLLGQAMLEAGFRRKVVKRDKQGIKKEATDELADLRKDKTKFRLGLRDVLRGLKQNKLAAVLYDESLLKPSTVTNIFALIALNNPIQMYAIPELGKAVGPRLNMPSTSAIGISEECGELIDRVREAFTPIGLSAKKRLSEAPSVFESPTLESPMGKAGKKRKKKKKREISGLLLP